MSNIKINYHQYHSTEVIKSPFSLDEIGFEPQRAYSKYDEYSLYSECPAWKHKMNRTFYIRSPVDIDIVIDRKMGAIYSTNVEPQVFNQYCAGTFVPGWMNENNITIQLSIPRFMFWTKHKNIWIESKPHYLTSVKNNFTSIPAWYNMSNWHRPLGTSFNVIDINKPVSIKRGDVLYEVCFYSKNLDDGILLKKSPPEEKIFNKMYMMIDLKHHIRRVSSKYIFKNKDSKCPFHFMWK